MRQCLYLDTARLGKMSPRACRASIDLSRFSYQHGASSIFMDLLEQGFASWPTSRQDRFRGLEDWNGLSTLLKRIKQVANAHDEQECVVASRSTTLTRLAGRLMFGPCRNVLMTDLTWPAYSRLLVRQRLAANAKVTRIAVRRRLLLERLSTCDLIDVIHRAYTECQCDGLFLPLVDNFGIRLPVREIVDRIRSTHPLRFVVVDGAQAFGQLPGELGEGYCDFFVAGCHKWLRGHHPMGIAIFGKTPNQDYVADSLARWQSDGWIDDPLFNFTRELAAGRPRPFGETVQLTPLFTANAACVDQSTTSQERLSCITPTNRVWLRHLTIGTNWRMTEPAPELVSRIALLRKTDASGRTASVSLLGRRLLEHGVSATVLSRGVVRVSLPDNTFNDQDLRTLDCALTQV